MSDYFKNDSISYSKLRALSVGPAYYKSQMEQDSEEKEHFIIGSAVDILLTESDKFWDYYYLEFDKFDEDLPSPQMLKFIDYLVHNENCGEITQDCYKEAFEYAGIKQKKLDTVIKEFSDKYMNYYNYLIKKNIFNINNEGKQLLTVSQYDLVKNITNSLQNNRFTSKYFNTDFSNLEIHNQLEIYWEYDNIKCKSKLDKVIINHVDKTIMLIDLKTTGKSTFSFESSLYQYRYDIQAAFYGLAFTWLVKNQWVYLKDYTISGFYFIVESTKTIGFPLIYKCSDNLLNNALHGYYKNDKYYKGIIQLISDYKWYMDNNEWSYDKNIIENEGIIEL
jgi:hypothetical protein